MRGISDVTLRFAADEDLMELESKLDLGNGNGIWPRSDRAGNALRTWERYHQLGMNELGRRLRARKSTAEPMELGRLDARSKDRLRPVAAAFALHYLFMDAENSADLNNWMRDRAGHYWRTGGDWLDAEAIQLDYDLDNNGVIDESEKNQPFICRVIRG